MTIRTIIYSGLCALVAVVGALFSATETSAAGGETIHIEQQDWSFGGIFGTYDRAQLQRGFQIYKENCAACHSMRLLSFRNLGEPGGPELSKEDVDVLAAEAEILDGPNDEGEMYTRPGKSSDRFPSPFANEKAAAAVNNGAVPPDLSMIAKARGIHHDDFVLYAIVRWVKEIFSGYQEGGSDYMYALLTGYKKMPSGMKMSEGMHYNAAFPGHQIAMPAPLSDETVEYSDGTPATLDQHARDVTAFLTWAADPKMEVRKKTGFRVMLFLLVFAVLMYLVKRRIWAEAH